MTESFEEFWTAEVDGLYRALTLALGNADLAREAVDEGMTRAYQRWRKVSRYDNPAGWVYRVSLNWATSRLRGRRREVVTDDFRDGPSSADASLSSLDPELRRALLELSVPARSVVVLRYLLGWTTRETASALGVAEGTVKSRLARALADLERLLEER